MITSFYSQTFDKFLNNLTPTSYKTCSGLPLIAQNKHLIMEKCHLGFSIMVYLLVTNFKSIFSGPS